MASPPDRRGFLKVITTLLGAAAAGLATVPVIGSALSPLFAKKDESGGFLPAAAFNELEANVPRRVELIATVTDTWTTQVGVVGACWLLKKNDGSVSALSTLCPHSGCSINLQTKETYGCPCHASSFSFEGTPLEGPSPRPMDPLKTEVKDGKVSVRYARFKVGVKEREEL